MTTKLLILIIITGLFVFSCNNHPKNVNYEKYVVTKNTFPLYIYCQGRIDPLLVKQFKAEKKGTLHYNIPIEESIEHSPDTLIASISPLSKELHYSNVELYSQQKELQLFKKELALQEQLYNRGQISLNELERNRLSLTRKRIEVEQAAKKQSTQLINAPFKGHLSQISALNGAEVSEGADLFSWIDWSSLRVKMSIPDFHLQRIKRGKSVLVEGSMLKQPIYCQVATITGNSSDNFSQNASMTHSGSDAMTAAYLTINPSDIPLVTYPKGEVVCKYIDTVLTQTLCIPVGFLYFKGTQPYVLQADKKYIPVQLGIIGDSLAEITTGIAENDTIFKVIPGNEESFQ